MSGSPPSRSLQGPPDAVEDEVEPELELTLPYPAIGWVNIVVAVLVVVFNPAGLPYPGLYDNFLIIVSFAFNALVVWHAWTWVSAAA